MAALHEKAKNATMIELDRIREARRKEEEHEKKRQEALLRREELLKIENDMVEARMRSVEHKCKHHKD
jgi:hypothetical protein